ncbi:uncharacterized protein EI90DRAFT_3250023 [Cantharellus anzutake]|uniref:uncharacterized protein n=1 Tax=Cantharellus anzutake TaxID=1750568 RepID=UPI00190482EC|nr:uncharacterized protein EI90DRAFT_3250023 [Cantharellus anzutake]KAF8321891.1 hypothetical protein EI90DRAFT_3250023 [Cantharellus anzutake]
MARHADSLRMRKQKASQAVEEHMLQTLASYRAELARAQQEGRQANAGSHILHFYGDSREDRVAMQLLLSSTFKLPERVYGDGRSLQNIQWGLAEDTEYEKKTHEELIAELCETQAAFRNARDYVTSAVDAIDATNAQLALSGMYVSKARTQLLSREEGEKNKEEGGRIKGVFGRVVTHEGFIQQQSDRAKKREMEDVVEKAKKEAQKGWEEFQRHQKVGEAAWKVQKEQLQALKQKVPKKRKAVTKKDWMAENYPQLVISPSDTVKECGKGVEEPICDADEQ